MDALAHLSAVAAEFQVEALTAGRGTLTFTLPVVLPSEETIRFHLEARAGAVAHVLVRELAPHRLPRCCPERHINGDGSFCMHWLEGDPRPVIDELSARAWWALLWDFLTAQLTAAKIGRWSGRARAHGAAAAFQDRAEQCVAQFGEPLASQLAQGQLATRLDQRRGRNRIELALRGQVLNRLNLASRMLTNPDMPCPCADGRAQRASIGACQTHARDFVELIDALYRWRKAEEQYVAALRARGVRCCRTLERCPLK